MKASLLLALALAPAAITALEPLAAPGSTSLRHATPHLPLGLFRTLQRREARSRAVNELLGESEGATRQDNGRGPQHTFSTPSHELKKPTFEAKYFAQRISHSSEDPHEGRFAQRYWYDDQFYKDGGPVFVLDGGETSGEDRIPFLETGILRILSKATNGLGIVLEHRYYGTSFPTANLSTDSLRFLTTMQSLKDGEYFQSHVGADIPALANSTKASPWIYYGGSYAGAKAAFARKLFPKSWWGGIASSAVTEAVLDYWQYFESVRLNGPEECISNLIAHGNLVDTLLGLNSPLLTKTVKGLFGLPNITLDTDFVNTLSVPLGFWQAKNWDPKVGSHEFDKFCHYLTANTSEDAVSPLLARAIATLPAHKQATLPALSSLVGYSKYIKERVVPLCDPEETQDECFGTTDEESFLRDSLDEAPWRSWTYQVCTEWGYFITPAPQKNESLISSLLTMNYTSSICKKAFPPGEVNRVPKHPNVTEINQWGGFNFTYPRLAFIDGSADPWIYATPHSPSYKHNKHRKSTTSQPFELIKGGVHHWDENGLLNSTKEPHEIKKIHQREIDFVTAWVDQWEKRGKWKVGEPDDA